MQFIQNTNTMKRTAIMLGAGLILSLTFTSCKKEYTCSCSKTYTTGTGTYTKDNTVYTYNENRKRAEDRCNENTKSGSDILGDYSINCQIQ